MTATPDIFAEFSDLDEGNVQRDGDETLADVIEAVKLHGKAGKVTLTMIVEPAFRDGQMGVLLAGKVGFTKPERKPEGSFRYIRKDGSLSKANPGQTRLPFNTVPTDIETRQVGDTNADVRSI